MLLSGQTLIADCRDGAVIQFDGSGITKVPVETVVADDDVFGPRLAVVAGNHAALAEARGAAAVDADDGTGGMAEQIRRGTEAAGILRCGPGFAAV